MTTNTSAAAEKMIKLRSSDGELFQIEEKVAAQSITIKNIIDNGDSVIPILNVTGMIFAKVIEYCKHHVEAMNANDKKAFDAEFVKVDQKQLFELIHAATYLNIEGLLNLTCQTVADMIKGKQPEEIREIFDIENDYTPEEEEELRKKYSWAFQ